MTEFQFAKQKFPISQKSKPISPRDILQYILSLLIKKTVHGFKFDGKRDRIWKYWYDDGNRNLEQSWKDGEKNGIWKWWYKNGQLKCEESWKDGKEIN